ncbi:MAG: abortive infection family protein [Thiotrichaceae bacterium]|nr:abortive infection family protein [Thiotrichaceae bacterium]
MDSLNELINRHLNDFPEFSYYQSIIKKAKNNKAQHPDISIECCNSLIQGICKTIILRLDSSKTEKDFKRKDTQDLIKPALKLLRVNDDVFENDFITRSASIALAVSTLRNARGDISHGRAVPKKLESDRNLARVVMEMTGSLLRYTLASFYAIELVDREDDITYEKNEEFNNYLDELNPLNGKPLYSLALYQQYNEDYKIQLSDYLYEVEQDEEES